MRNKSTITIALVATLFAIGACKDDKKAEPAADEPAPAKKAEEPKEEAETKPTTAEAEPEAAEEGGDGEEEMEEPSADDFD